MGIDDDDMMAQDPQSIENEVAFGAGVRIPAKKKKKKANAAKMDVQPLPGMNGN